MILVTFSLQGFETGVQCTGAPTPEARSRAFGFRVSGLGNHAIAVVRLAVLDFTTPKPGFRHY